MAVPELIDNYLFVGARMVERLRDQLPALGLDIAPQDVMVIEDRDQLAASGAAAGVTIFVLWDGEAFPQGDRAQADTSPTQLVRQIWTVMVKVRHVGQQRLDDEHNAAAGRWLSAVHRALAGWTPAGLHRPLRRSQAPGRPDYRANEGLYPLAFSVPMHL